MINPNVIANLIFEENREFISAMFEGKNNSLLITEGIDKHSGTDVKFTRTDKLIVSFKIRGLSYEIWADSLSIFIKSVIEGEKTDADIAKDIIMSNTSLLSTLYFRWENGKAYEDIKDFKKPVVDAFKEGGGDVLFMTRTPFGCNFKVGKTTFKVRIIKGKIALTEV